MVTHTFKLTTGFFLVKINFGLRVGTNPEEVVRAASVLDALIVNVSFSRTAQ